MRQAGIYHFLFLPVRFRRRPDAAHILRSQKRQRLNEIVPAPRGAVYLGFEPGHLRGRQSCPNGQRFYRVGVQVAQIIATSPLRRKLR